MRTSLILSLVIAIVAVIFALQNPGLTTIQFGPLETQGSTALVILLTFAAGVIVGILATLPGRIRARRRSKSLEKQLKERQEPSSITTEPSSSMSSVDPMA